MEQSSPAPSEPAPEPVRCAHCDSRETEMIALFGQSLMVSQYYCHACHSVFEAVRWTEEEKP